MNILVYGAGVLGSIYAARLQESGQKVSLLARGQRLPELREHGIVLENVVSRQKTTTHVTVVESLAAEDTYDLVIVLMRKNQVASILPVLAANEASPNILFMTNNAAGFDQMIQALGNKRILLGFAGVGGTREKERIRYLTISQQPTTLGELSGIMTPRLQQIVKVFENADFSVVINPTMDAWLKTHAIFITAVEAAVIMAGGNNYQLAHQRDILKLMVQAIREGFQVLRVLGIPVTPSKLKTMFETMPILFPISYWQRAFNSLLGEICLAAHAKAAPDELQQLADEIRVMIRKTAVATPATDKIFSVISSAAGTVSL